MIAHRGGRQPGVRRTRSRARGAITAGADFIEFDVRRTADGALVINHDARLDGLSIARVPLERLRALPHPPALLAEVVAQVGGRIGMDVELKEAGYEGGARELEPVLRTEPQCSSSFVEQAVAAVRRLAPNVSAGLLLGNARGVERKAAACDATLVLPWWRFDVARFRARRARLGLPEAPWTVDDPRAIAARLRDPRVAGVITNLPERALELRARETGEALGSLGRALSPRQGLPERPRARDGAAGVPRSTGLPSSGLEARFKERCRRLEAPRVLELGTARAIPERSTLHRDLVPHAAEFLGTDIVPGADVDIVADVHRLSEVAGEAQVDGSCPSPPSST